jgi:hypothetical protein
MRCKHNVGRPIAGRRVKALPHAGPRPMRVAPGGNGPLGLTAP